MCFFTYLNNNPDFVVIICPLNISCWWPFGTKVSLYELIGVSVPVNNELKGKFLKGIYY